jgi:hypothetical protein
MVENGKKMRHTACNDEKMPYKVVIRELYPPVKKDPQRITCSSD